MRCASPVFSSLRREEKEEEEDIADRRDRLEMCAFAPKEIKSLDVNKKTQGFASLSLAAL